MSCDSMYPVFPTTSCLFLKLLLAVNQLPFSVSDIFHLPPIPLCHVLLCLSDVQLSALYPNQQPYKEGTCALMDMQVQASLLSRQLSAQGNAALFFSAAALFWVIFMALAAMQYLRLLLQCHCN